MIGLHGVARGIVLDLDEYGWCAGDWGAISRAFCSARAWRARWALDNDDAALSF